MTIKSQAILKSDYPVASARAPFAVLDCHFPLRICHLVNIHYTLSCVSCLTSPRRAVELTEEKFDSQKFHIVTVGRVSYEKGMDLAVLACERLVKNGFKNICWWIVGDGPAMEEIKNLVNKKKVESYVKLVGMKENPYPYMRQANLYVQPSRIESFGLTILEALIIGKKVIATNTWGAKQLLCNRVDGILCDIDDASLANKIKELLEKQQFNVHSNIFEIEKMCIEKNKQALRIIKKIL